MTDTLIFDASMVGNEYDKMHTALAERGDSNPETTILHAMNKGPQSWETGVMYYTLTHLADGVFTLSIANLVA